MSKLHDAVLSGDVDLVIAIVEGGADVNDTNNSGVSPLHVAASCDFRGAIIEHLLMLGADVNLKMGKHTPRDMAVMHGNRKAVRIFTENGGVGIVH